MRGFGSIKTKQIEIMKVFKNKSITTANILDGLACLGLALLFIGFIAAYFAQAISSSYNF
jgi:hypothetical protein